MNRKLLGGAIVGVLAAIAVWFLWLRGGDDRPGSTASTAREANIVAPTEPTPVQRDTSAPAPRGAAPRWSLDKDPPGTLVLEGQVLGPDGGPVGGATVWLGSVPPRTTTTEDDGSFSFDKLVARTYALSAHDDEFVGGPVSYKLTATSDPVVIHLTAGASLEVTVVDESDRPVEGADVKAGDGIKGKTGVDGKVSLRPVRPGWVTVVASAAGYAPSTLFTTIGGGRGELTVRLRKGYAVSGKVVDEAGKPVAGAAIHAEQGVWGRQGTGDDDLVTGPSGTFEIPALAPGSYVLVALDGEHAPARSNPITVKDRAVTGIVITMQPGGVFAGTVVTPDGTPAPFATVRITGKGEDAWQAATPRQATTDERGAFEIRGLARTTLQARAESETAASKIVDVDLQTQSAVRDARLVLDVTGQIAGIVVDETGAPVPEVQVNAFPDLLGGADTEGLALAGMSSATTDGGGRFTITGLPDGAYRLWAARSSNSGAWGEQGVKASTGDTDVRIVLASPGKLVGKLALESGGAPASGFVQLGWNPPVPTKKEGAFELEELGPGSYDVTFRGPDFEETVRRDVKIEPGKVTDLGTIVVHRGRRLTGKVTGKNGPVEGAKVKVGEMLLSAEGNESQMDALDGMYGTRTAVTDQNGEFTILGISKKSQTIIAEHPDLGRSSGYTVPAGTEDPPPFVLTLRAFGALSGVVTMQGKPQGNVQITVALKDGGASAVLAQTDATGAFHLPRVPEGEVVVQAVKAGMMKMKSATTSATVVAGRETTVSIDIPVGDIALTVQLTPKDGAQVDAAQVFLLDGEASPENAKALNDGFFQSGAQGMKFWLGKEHPMPVFDELVAKTYSVCTIPITGDLSNPQFSGRLQAHLESVKVYCKKVELAPSPNKQTIVQELPAMDPLPDN